MEAKEIITLLGGSAKTAKLCQTTQQAVCQWVKAGIPDYRLAFLKLARPDIFGMTSKQARRLLPK